MGLLNIRNHRIKINVKTSFRFTNVIPNKNAWGLFYWYKSQFLSSKSSVGIAGLDNKQTVVQFPGVKGYFHLSQSARTRFNKKNKLKKKKVVSNSMGNRVSLSKA